MSNPEHYQRLSELFERVCALHGPEREAALADADPALRREVRELLEEEESHPSFLAQPVIDLAQCTTDGDIDTDSLIGRQIRHYKIRGVIATGGMGTVYEAVQDNPSRVVALKVLRRHLDSTQARRRFEYESQVLARLNHPNIAQVYEAGTHEERRGDESWTIPFFAMEHVQGGLPIDEYARQHELGLRERLALFAQVCDAVHHGHQKGVIHRDLKPANILVEPSGTPKIIDFGVARATDSDLVLTSLHTDVGQLIGTLSYMSPEQCRADPNELDTRSDVYALGVVLYELLCDRLPYDLKGAALVETTRRIQEQMPEHPSKIRAALRGDVETITLKALEKEPPRRYQSAADLAEDLRRYLGNQPIAARPPSAIYQLTKLARRHRAVTVAAATTVIALVAGIIATSAESARANVAEGAALELAQKEVGLRSLADDARQRAEEREEEALVAAAIAREVNDFLNKDLLGSVAPEVARGRQITVREVFDTAARSLDGRFDEHPQVEAAIRGTLGRTYLALGQPDVALPHLRTALDLHRAALDARAPETLASLHDLGIAQRGLMLLKEAEDNLTRAWQERRLLLGDSKPDTLRSAHALAQVYIRQTDYDRASSLLENTLRRAEQIENEDLILGVRAAQALVLWETGSLEEAAEIQEDILFKRLETHPEEHPIILTLRMNLGASYMMMLDKAKARPHLDKALENAVRVLGEGHPDTLGCRNNLLFIALEEGRPAEVLEDYEKLLADCDEHLGPDQFLTIIVRSNLGRALIGVDRHAEAIPLLEQALEDCRAVVPGHWLEAEHLRRLGQALVGVGRKDEGEEHLRLSVKLARERLAPNDGRTIRAAASLVRFLEREGRREEAAVEYAIMLEELQVGYGEDHEETLREANNYGLLLFGLDRFEEAMTVFRRTYEILRDSRGELYYPTCQAQFNLAVQYASLGEKENDQDLRNHGITHMQQVVVNSQKGAGTTDVDSPFTARARVNLGMFLNEAGRFDEALEVLDECLDQCPPEWDTRSEKAIALRLRATTFRALGRDEDAEFDLLEGYSTAERSKDKNAAYARRDLAKTLVEFYESLGDEEQAAVWRACLEGQ